MEKRSPCWLAKRVKSNVSGVGAAEGASSVAGLVQAPPGGQGGVGPDFRTTPDHVCSCPRRSTGRQDRRQNESSSVPVYALLFSRSDTGLGPESGYIATAEVASVQNIGDDPGSESG
jgi:hypothetical protein